jgi:hypothetical protein
MTRILCAGAMLVLVALPARGTPGGGLDRISREKILAAAREIDRLVEADLAANGLVPNPPLDDASFARRVYLDLAGRIPTGRELDEFLGSSASERREALIDKLLESPASSSHLFNWLADLLRVKTRLNNQTSGEPYIHFIKESLAANKPWDAFVRDLLTASGPAHKRGHGATGYMLRDRGMPEDNMSNTITVFLGTRLECAQCHNHPFDKWTQLQYFEMVAFTGGIRYTDDTFPKTPEGQRLKTLGDSFRTAQGRERSLESRAFGQITQTLQYGISGTGTGLYRLPKDYKYEDARANEPVKAKAMFGAEVPLAVEVPAERRPDPKARRAPSIRASDVNSREAYAKWLTAAENPRFATVIANRLWKRFFGLGVIEPVDNLREGTKPVNPALMEHLRATMVGMGFDLRQYLRVLANSKTYQREACRKDVSDEAPFRFPGPVLRRMSAEQLWDSMLTLVVPDLDSTLLQPGEAAEPVYAAYERLANLSPEQAKSMVDLEVLRQKDPAKYREARQKMEAEAREAQKANPEIEKKNAQLKDARKKGDDAEVAKLREELQKLTAGSGAPAMMDMRSMYRGGERNRNALSRASDLPQPANPGHFLREFGQSDREQIEASHRLSSVPQALSLLNGFVDKSVLPNAKSAIRTAVASAPSPAGKVTALFRGILNRDPSAPERAAWEGDVQKRGDAAVRDLIWTLVNTHEFMFIR